MQDDESIPSWLVDRQYAYFRIVGQDNLNWVEGALGYSADAHRNAGDTIAMKNGRSRTAKSSSWKLESRLPDTERLETHIEALLERLESKGAPLAEVLKSVEASIVCVSFSGQSLGFILTPEIQKRSVALGLSFEFDFYSLVDPAQEIEKLRAALE